MTVSLVLQAVMAPGTMKSPMCLVENKNKQLLVNPEAIYILNNISQPVVVVAIVGMYRTGKSYLMNCLAGQNNGECCPRQKPRLHLLMIQALTCTKDTYGKANPLSST